MGYFEPVVPVHDAYAICLPLREIIWQVIANASPKQRRDAPYRRQVVLVHIVQHLVIQGDHILQLRLRQAALGRGDVGERMKYKDAAMLWTKCSFLQCSRPMADVQG